MTLQTKQRYYMLPIQLALFIILLIFSHTSFPASKHSIRTILMVIAMEEEAAPIIQLLHLSSIPPLDPKLPMKAYSGTYGNLNIKLILNGKDPKYGVQNVGTQPAVLSTYLGISHFHPDLVMSIGTAGSCLNKKVKVGEIYTSNIINFYDRRLHSPKYQLYGIGGYRSAITTEMSRKLNLKTGIVCSSDSFEESDTDKAQIKKIGCMIIDMEAAGVSWVALLTQTPMFALKGITNYTDVISSHDDFKKNFTKITNELALKTKEILDYLLKNPLH